MIANQASLHGIYTAFNVLFSKAFSATTTLYDKVATIVPSTTREENYKWLGALPRMREWIGEREIQNLSASDYTIKNKPFELTLGVDRDDIEDDTLGIYNPTIQDLGQAAAQHPDELVFPLLPDGFTNLCYDKQPFFSDKHKINKKNVSNMGHDKLTPESYAAARSTIMNFTNDKGAPLKLIPNLLVVPPALETMARKILLADLIDNNTNVMKGTADPLVVPDLAGYDTSWFLLSTNMPLKPLIYQERKAPKFTALTNETDPNVFLQKQFLYGIDSRGNAGYGFWQMAFGSDGTAAQ